MFVAGASQVRDSVPPYNDEYNRANAADIATGEPSWTNRCTAKLKINSNIAAADTTASWVCADYIKAPRTNNVRASALIGGTTSAGETYMIGVRTNNAKQIWGVLQPGSTWGINSNANTYANPNTTPTGRAATVGNVALASGDAIDMEAFGNAYVLKKNGAAVCAWYDAATAYTYDATNRQPALAGYLLVNNGFNSWDFDDLPVDTFYPSQATKSGTQAWQTSASWVDITTWTAVLSAAYATALSGNGFVVLAPCSNAILSASIPYTGSTVGLTHQVRICVNGTPVGLAGTNVTTASGTATCTVTGVSVAAGDVITVQMLGSAASAGTITATTPTLAMVQPVAIGFSIGDEIYDTATWTNGQVDTYFSTLVAEGATWARIPFMWNFIQPTRTTWDWTRIDYIYSKAAAAGVRLVAMLHANRNATVSGSPWFGGTDTPAEYGNFCQEVAKRYPLIKDFEIWNEANHITFWVRAVSVSEYTTYLSAAADALRFVRPGCMIYTGGSMCLPFPPAGSSPDEWVTGIITNGGKTKFNGVSNHPYNYHLTPAFGNDNWTEWDACSTALKNAGVASRQVICTEYGTPTTPNTGGTSFSVAQQQTSFNDAAGQIAARPMSSVQLITIYELVDSRWYPGPTPNEQGAFGIYYNGTDGTHADWVRKT